MTAQEFITSKGNITDPNIRFVKAGNTVVVPLADLLDEYVGVNAPKIVSASGPSKKPKKKA